MVDVRLRIVERFHRRLHSLDRLHDLRRMRRRRWKKMKERNRCRRRIEQSLMTMIADFDGSIFFLERSRAVSAEGAISRVLRVFFLYRAMLFESKMTMMIFLIRMAKQCNA